MSKILMTVGPIPARLDSVKYITNRFKGGLALKTAEKLRKMGHNVTLVAWEHLQLDTDLKVITVPDVNDYFDKVLSFKADAYILAAAVANLAPLNPYEGKFPSHKYKEGDTFNIKFTIAPRTVDAVKKKHPRSTLIAYKLYDGTDGELVKAAQKTLFQSKANVVFANNPKWAKSKKIVVTADGAEFPVSFDKHIEIIDQIIREKFYSTSIIKRNIESLGKDMKFVVNNYPKHKKAGMIFGTFAVRTGNGFITTSRGKELGTKNHVFVKDVDHIKRVVYANQKATLNAPLLHKLFQKNKHVNFLIHGHELIGKKIQSEYKFPGTVGDLENVFSTKESKFLIQLPHHGYIAGFSDFEECKRFINKHHVE